MPKKRENLLGSKQKKCLTKFFNTKEYNETSKEFDIEEVNSEAGSTREKINVQTNLKSCGNQSSRRLLCIVNLNKLSLFG
jgi:hypothetical protein